MTRPTVILGMSGGVDSSVAASLLVEQGFEVQGVTLQVWEQEDESVAVSKRWQERSCCKVGLAKYVAKRLGIAHEVIARKSPLPQSPVDRYPQQLWNSMTARIQEQENSRSCLRPR